MTYYFNFGREHNKKCKGQNAAVTEVLEVLKQPTDTCEILGRPEHRTVGLLDPNKPNKGIYVQYGGGDKCTNGANLIQRDKPRETRFNIHCARKQSDFVIDTPTGSQGATKCILEFRVDSPAGCPGGVYGGVSLFIIMIWGILLFCVYLFGGIAYNINYKNLSGIEAVPNIDFWREFPTYVKDAIVYTFSGISSGINMIRTGMKSRVPENYSDI